jgi:hydroxymethylpyrimidine/phosphomethylpyrimidine kinase
MDYNFALTIAGFDPSAGAGVLADIKAFEHCKVYGQAVCTSLTIQNEKHFKKTCWLPWMQIKEQLETLFKIHSFKCIKIGLVENPETLEQIFKWLRKKSPESFILWDPILKASSGFEFHTQNALSWQKLFAYANLITPNLPEARFLGIEKGSEQTAVLLKGGHSPATAGKYCQDVLFPALSERNSPAAIKFASKRINAERHGSGCTLSALIIANLIKCNDLEKAIGKAKKTMQTFFANGTGKLGSLLPK